MFVFKHSYLIVPTLLALNEIINCTDVAPHWRLKTYHHGVTLEEGIKRYFETKTNVLHVRVHLRLPGPWKYVILNHLTGVLRNSTKLTFRITIEDKYLRCNRNYLHNLWYVDSYEALDDVLPYKKSHFGSSPGVYAIILEPIRGQNVLENIQNILEKMFSLNIVDVNVIVSNPNGTGFLVYSFDVFSENHCRIVKPRIFNQFIHGHFNEPELFPDKFENFHNCPIHFISRSMPPFFSYYKNINGSLMMKGLEAKLLETLAEHLQFRIELHVDTVPLFGDVYPNGTMTGPYYLLDNKVVDVLMGNFFYAAYTVAFLEESSSYFSTEMVAIMKHHPYTSNLTWMIDPFQLDAWLALMATMAAAIVFVYVSRLRYHSGNWLDIVGGIIGEPCRISTSNGMARFGIALWYGGFVFISSAYQAKLFDSYSKPKPNVPHTLNGLLESNYTFLVRTHTDLNIWLPGINWPENRIKFFNSPYPNYVLEKLLNSTGRVATLSTVARIRYFEYKHKLSNAFDKIPETVQLTESCAYFQHHSYLVSPFNRVLLMISRSGLISRWYDENIVDPKKSLQMQGNSTPKSFDMERFSIVFILFICGQLLAVTVMVVEMVVGYN